MTADRRRLRRKKGQ
ncbi:unnamed protein product, partial [Acanthoscelides obtectus]